MEGEFFGNIAGELADRARDVGMEQGQNIQRVARDYFEDMNGGLYSDNEQIRRVFNIIEEKGPGGANRLDFLQGMRDYMEQASGSLYDIRRDMRGMQNENRELHDRQADILSGHLDLLSGQSDMINGISSLAGSLAGLAGIDALPQGIGEAVRRAADFLPQGADLPMGGPDDVLRDIFNNIAGSQEMKDNLMDRLGAILDGPNNGGNNDGNISAGEIGSAFDNDSVLNQLTELNATISKMFKDPNFRSRTIAKIQTPSIYGEDDMSQYNQVDEVQQGFALNESDTNIFNVNF